MRVFLRLWTEEAGFVISSELVLVATILVIGLIVGMTSLRNQVVQELADVGAAIGNISQGYEYFGVSKQSVGDTDGSGWDDKRDFCQTTPVTGSEPAGISVRVAPVYSNAVPGED
jgi:hypothetical protein